MNKTYNILERQFNYMGKDHFFYIEYDDHRYIDTFYFGNSKYEWYCNSFQSLLSFMPFEETSLRNSSYDSIKFKVRNIIDWKTNKPVKMKKKKVTEPVTITLEREHSIGALINSLEKKEGIAFV